MRTIAEGLARESMPRCAGCHHSAFGPDALDGQVV